MKKYIFIGITLLILVSGVYLLLRKNNNSSLQSNIYTETTVQNSEELTNDDFTTEDNTKSKSDKGLGYVEYSEQALSDSSGSKRVLFFHAPWCSTCNFYEGQIEKQGVSEGITILKVDYDSESGLKQKYRVNVQSTFVLLDSDGNIEKAWPFASGLSGIQDLYDQV
jgi:thiol-disulfide isomerase/thioredoxin